MSVGQREEKEEKGAIAAVAGAGVGNRGRTRRDGFEEHGVNGNRGAGGDGRGEFQESSKV